MKKLFQIVAVLTFSSAAVASDINVDMYAATPSGPGAHVGTVIIGNAGKGAVFSLDLKGMQPFTKHGFHIHENGICAPAEKDGKVVPALAAGGHWDPMHTGKHEGWQGQGHLGDLPRLEVDSKGQLSGKFTVPRITDISILKGLAMMVHLNGDNYADVPKKLGGGGARMFCGVIQ